MGLSSKQRYDILERDGFRCQACGAGPLEQHLEVDHRISVKLGGGNDPGNLQVLCRRCNRGKGAR